MRSLTLKLKIKLAEKMKIILQKLIIEDQYNTADSKLANKK